EAAALAGDRGEALLERAQPVDEVVDHGAVVKAAHGGDHVLVLPAALGHGVRRDRGVLLARDPAGQVDVVGGEVLDHADVRDAVREGALAAGDDLVDVAELTGLQAGAQREQRRVAPLDVAAAGDQAARLEGVDEAAGPGDRVG